MLTPAARYIPFSWATRSTSDIWTGRAGAQIEPEVLRAEYRKQSGSNTCWSFAQKRRGLKLGDIVGRRVGRKGKTGSATMSAPSRTVDKETSFRRVLRGYEPETVELYRGAEKRRSSRSNGLKNS
jgi:hypothetical protein